MNKLDVYKLWLTMQAYEEIEPMSIKEVEAIEADYQKALERGEIVPDDGLENAQRYIAEMIAEYEESESE